MGAMGATGAMGAMGAMGATGAMGAMGATGAMGAMGAAGAMGAIACSADAVPADAHQFADRGRVSGCVRRIARTAVEPDGSARFDGRGAPHADVGGVLR